MASQSPARPPSRLRRLLLLTLTFCVVWVTIEITALGLHFWADGQPYPKSQIKRAMNASLRPQQSSGPEQGEGGSLTWNQVDIGWGQLVEVIHPYLGYVLDPDRNATAVSDIGFLATHDRDEALPIRADDLFVVGVFGGSFAAGVADLVPEVFESCPAVDGRRVVMRRIALGGYKQPQQVMGLAYLSTLGAQFDLVMNVDGFNELALPLFENAPNGVNPHYPRMWHLRAGGMLGPERARALGRLELVRDLRDAWARWFLDGKLYRSPTLQLFWQTGDAVLARRGQLEMEYLAAEQPTGTSAAIAGPHWAGTGASGERALGLLADHWALSSRQMHALAQANGARYVHVLQPNQHVPGSKPFSAEERATALIDGPYRETARNGYPMLIERGVGLREDGIEFLDLTRVFAEEDESRYIDACCHVDVEGYRQVVQAICDAL